MKPLEISNIFITKSKEEVSSKFLLLENYCNSILYLPTIKIKPIIDDETLSKIKINLDKYHYIVFTSKNAVDVFIDFFSNEKELINKKTIVAIGESTAKKSRELKINVDILPENFSSNGLVTLFSSIDVKGKYFLIPTSKLSSNDLKLNLENHGAIVDLIYIYDVLPNYEIRKSFDYKDLDNIDVFIFTSPSSFNNFIEIFEIKNPDVFFEKKIICAIGKTTEKEINNHGINVNVVPQNYSLDYLTDALMKFYNIQKNIA